MPVASLCIPTYNHARMLGDALRSAMAQTCRDIEILVFDDGSTDETPNLVSAFLHQDTRIRYFRNAENLGLTRNFNACLAQAKGEYIKFLCDDDSLEPDCVERMAQVLSERPEVTLVACARRLVDDRLRAVGTARYAQRSILVEGPAAIRRCFFLGNLIGEPTAVMFRRTDAARGFDDRYLQLMDLEMWFHLLRRGTFAFLPTPLCRIRQHAEQATRENLRSGTVLRDKCLLFREYVDEVGKHAGLTEKLFWDARMAVTVWSTRNAGHAVRLENIEEVFFSRLFPTLTYPAISALSRLLDREQ